MSRRSPRFRLVRRQWISSVTSAVTTPNQARVLLSSPRFAGIPDVHYGEDEHWVCGDHAVSEWLITGTTTAGEPVRVRGCDLFDLDPQWASSAARTLTGKIVT